MDRENIERKFKTWCDKLRLTPAWDMRLEWVDDAGWRKTGDLKIDCDGKRAIVMLNGADPKQENLRRWSCMSLCTSRCTLSTR